MKTQTQNSTAQHTPIPPMPHVEAREPADDRFPSGYLESLRDWISRNEAAVEWFLDNSEAIRVALARETAAPELLAIAGKFQLELMRQMAAIGPNGQGINHYRDLLAEIDAAIAKTRGGAL